MSKTKLNIFDCPSGTELQVCTDIAQRQAHGMAKYGTTVEANPLSQRQWLQHLYEELLDAAVYTRRLMEQMDRDAACNAELAGPLENRPTPRKP